MDRQELRVLQLSDCHLPGPGGGVLFGVDCAAAWECVVRHLRRLPPPELVLLTGDLAHEGDEGAYRRLARTLTGWGAPVFALAGNHDHPDRLRAVLVEEGVGVGGDVELAGWRLVLLDSVRPGKTAGRLGEAELERLEGILASDPACHVLVALHHPPVPVGTAWMDAMGLEDAAAFWEVVDRHPRVRAVAFGHVHQAFEARRGKLLLAAAPSTCVQFRPGGRRAETEPLPPGWRWWELEAGGAVRTWTERLPRAGDASGARLAAGGGSEGGGG